MAESTMVTDHINTLKTLFSQLTTLGHNIEENERAELLLQSLPDSYDQLIINLTNNNPADSLVFDDVAASVFNEESRRKNKKNRQASSQQAEVLLVTRGRSTERGPSGSQNHGRSKSRSKKNVKCYNCGKKGHVKKECWSNQKRREGKKPESSNAHGCVASTSDDGEILYSEATTVSEGRKQLSDVWLIDLGATRHMTSRREWFHTYEPISGGSVYMGNDHALEIAGIGTIKIKMFDGTIRTIGEVQHVNGLKKNLLSLGQMDSHGYKTHVENEIMKIVKGALVLMKAEKIGANLFMFKRDTLQEADAWAQIDLIHSDVWESLDISMGGAKYMVTFIDDYSKRCWVYPIKKKLDVFLVFKEYKVWVELESGKKIKCLRTDNGGEYTDGEFLAFYKQEEAAKTACYIVNRSPSTAIGLKTAIEMWTEKSANYSYLHAFGCPVNSDSSEVTPEHEEQEPVESEAPEVRRSTRERRPPTWHSEYVTEINVAYCLLTENGEPSTFHEALKSSDVALWMTAMQEEIEALHKNKTWELVPLPRGRKAIGNKWVYKIKRDGNDQMERYRARLVVKGYAQKEGIDFNEIFSPVVRLTTVRVVLAMCATLDLHFEQLDVKTAFLHGELEEEIYMLQPKGFAEIGNENLVCRLNKSLYGLKQAPRCWYKRFDSFIMSLGYNRLSSDHCAYYKRFEDNDFIILLLYVDDMLVAVGAISRYMTNPGGEHWIAVKRILRYIRGTSDVALCYGRSEFTVRGYVDSDFAGDLDKKKSTTGYVFTLTGAAVSWVSKLQTVVALSTTEAEYMAATQACKEAIWI
ncbi:retrovirus-related pol polyprotein from transposon TNT 1-94-like protein [Citrus sinensis]|nr:retrovirus-related pol polyprotein from transposon TNT 1-94-like protein [Citrus sinensis]